MLLALTTLATLLYVAGLVLAGRRLWRARDLVDGETLVWWSLVAVTGFVVTGKVLSPQYLLWLLPVVAAGLVVADGRAIRGWAAGLLVAAALTQIVFPLTYGAITTGTGPPLWVPVLALAGRNLVLVWLLSVAAVELWLSFDRAQRGSELDRQPPGPDASGPAHQPVTGGPLRAAGLLRRSGRRTPTEALRPADHLPALRSRPPGSMGATERP